MAVQVSPLHSQSSSTGSFQTAQQQLIQQIMLKQQQQQKQLFDQDDDDDNTSSYTRSNNNINNNNTSSNGARSGVVFRNRNENDSQQIVELNNDNYDHTIETAPSYDTFNLIDRNPILDNEASKFKSSLVKRSSLGTRHLPNSNRDTTTVTSIIDDTTPTTTTTESTSSFVNSVSTNGNSHAISEPTTLSFTHSIVTNAYMNNNNNNNNQEIDDSDSNEDLINYEASVNSAALLGAYRQQNTSQNLVFSPDNLNTQSSPQFQQQYHQQTQIPRFSYIGGNIANSYTSPIEDWSCEQVAQWLAINDMAIYSEAFLEKSIDGEKLVSLDNSKLKTLGVKNQKDRDIIKNKVKDMKADDKKRFKMLLENSTKKKKLKT